MIMSIMGGSAEHFTLSKTAVGATEGITRLYRSRKKTGEPWTASSSTHKPKNVLAAYPWLEFPDSIEVPVTTLDVYCEQHNIRQVDFVKMDVQGAEIDVIRGGQATFARTKYLLTEVVENEEYEGQLGLDGLVAALPGKWSLVERLLNDALLINET
jgi:FkbM family methyltransferase